VVAALQHKTAPAGGDAAPEPLTAAGKPEETEAAVRIGTGEIAFGC
jgi:hypothetical protein